jgi:hypothetical protein
MAALISRVARGERSCTAEESVALPEGARDFWINFWIHSETRENERDRADASGRDEVVVS